MKVMGSSFPSVCVWAWALSALLMLSGLINAQEWEDRWEDRLEDSAEDELEDRLEDQLERLMDDRLDENAEHHLDQTLDDRVEEWLERRLENELDDEITDRSESHFEEDLEDRLESWVEDYLEEHIDDRLAPDTDDALQEALQERLEEQLEHSLEHLRHHGDDDLPDNLDEALTDALQDYLEEQTEREGRETDPSDRLDYEALERVGAEWADESANVERVIDQVEADFEMAVNRQGEAIAKGHWLIMAPLHAKKDLIKQGFIVQDQRVLTGMDRLLLRVQTPANTTLNTIIAALPSTTSHTDVVIDHDHLYQLSDKQRPLSNQQGNKVRMPRKGLLPKDAYPFTPKSGLRIGMVDTVIQQNHPALAQANIVQKSFVASPEAPPNQHGTSVGSILVGRHRDYQGLAPEAELYSAAVFTQTEHPATQKKQPLARAQSLIQGLDWLIQHHIPVINMSLSGPPNRVLQTAIELAQQKGIVIVAAVGNKGPSSPPLFPAAYPNVIAVTAITQKKRIYRKAARGKHVDFSAYGVNIIHAKANSRGFTRSSGTSMAVPFVTAMIANAQKYSINNTSSTSADSRLSSLLKRFIANVDDLGAQGHDVIYGHGMIQPLSLSTLSKLPLVTR